MLQELKQKHFKKYFESIGNLEEKINQFKEKNKEFSFDFLKISSSVFSANIEGNSLDLNSFMNLDLNKKLSKDKKEIDNLILAYEFANKNTLNEINFLHTHKIASKGLLSIGNRGKYRNDKVGVFGKNGLIYLALEPEFVDKYMKDLFLEIKNILNKDLSVEEIFFYSSLIHLRFVHIHPFTDGNGRLGRIIEKWFLSERLGKIFWNIGSEEYYFKNRQKYYDNINLGVNFYEINYDKSLNFLIMLVNSII